MKNSVSLGSCCHETSSSGIGTEEGGFTTSSSERMKRKSKKKSSSKKNHQVNADWERSMNVGSSSSSSTVDQFSSTSSLLSHLVKTSHILNGYRSPLHPSKESDSVCGSDETSDPMETDQPVSESDSSSVKVIPIRSTSSDQNENKENIKESLSVPSVTLTRIDASASTSSSSRSASPSCSKSSSSSSHCDTTSDEPLPSCTRFQESSLSKVENCEKNSNSNFVEMSSSDNATSGCAQQQQMLQHHHHHQQQQQQQQTDYMGLALKQWSMYLGNVLLNFIHKECKNNNDLCGAAVEQVQQQQLSNLAVAVGSRATNSFLQAAVAAASSNGSSAGASCSQTASASGSSKSSRNKRSLNSVVPAVPVVNSASVDSAANLIGDATTVISQGYCPCCHYHSHLQQQQQFQQQQQTSTMNQQQQHVMLAAAAAAAQQQQQQQHAQQSCANNFQQGYYNYAANFSPFFSSQRHYVSRVVTEIKVRFACVHLHLESHFVFTYFVVLTGNK